jgi:hypothetical protein
MSKTRLNRSKSPKEMYVKILNVSSKQTFDGDLSRIKEEYDREGHLTRSWNVFSAAGIAASVALIASLSASVLGVPISLPEVFTLVSGSLMFGLLAGFILN